MRQDSFKRSNLLAIIVVALLYLGCLVGVTALLVAAFMLIKTGLDWAVTLHAHRQIDRLHWVKDERDYSKRLRSALTDILVEYQETGALSKETVEGAYHVAWERIW